MTTNVYNIEAAIMNKMSSASTELELLEYSKMLQQIKTGIVQVADTFASLPAYADSVGHMYYIKDEKTVYWANAASGWIPITQTSASTLWVMGGDYNNTVPDGVYTWPSDISSPVREVSSSTNWCQVSYGGSFSGGGVKQDGSLYVWGGYSGYCIDAFPNEQVEGVGAAIMRYTGSCDWSKVDYSGNTATGLKTNGEVWSWGCNCCGNFGDNRNITTATRTPQQELTSSTWTAVCRAHALAVAGIKTDGTLWGFGNGTVSGWGQGNTTNHSSPVQEICSATNWCNLSRMNYCTAAIKTDGTLWFAGQSSDGNFMNNCNLSQVFCSFVQEYTSSTNWSQVNFNIPVIALKTDGTLWGAGDNAYGGVGDGTNICRSSPVQEVTSSTNWCCAVRVSSAGGSSMGVKTDGTLWGWGWNRLQNVLIYPIACGNNHCTSSPVQEMTSHANGWGDINVRSGNAAFIRIDGTF